MALTMTRTRTQTTLTKLAQRVAEVHGELEYLEEVLAKEMPTEKRAVLEAKRLSVMGHRDALYLTIRQFDPRIDPAEIGAQAFTPGTKNEAAVAASLLNQML